jgi:ATP-dependent DNA helicase PIF1
MSDNVDTTKEVAEALAKAQLNFVPGGSPVERDTVSLTDEQERVVNYILEGRSMFLTGRAGTGKSFTLRHVIGMLPTSTTFITATTGRAAVNIGGTTYFRFAGIGLGNGSVAYIMQRLSRQGRANWLAARTLIIDEISMMKGQMFDKLEEIARLVRGPHFRSVAQTLHELAEDIDGVDIMGALERKEFTGRVAKRIRSAAESISDIELRHELLQQEIAPVGDKQASALDSIATRVSGLANRPFGGIQVIACGDFFQCPPVNKKFSEDDEDALQCFEADKWNEVFTLQVELTQVKRQSEQLALDFVNALRESETDRKGVVQLDQKWIELMDYLARPLKKRKDGILPTKLFCTNRDVDRENLAELQNLPGKVQTYLAVDAGRDPWRKDMETHCIAPSELKLKVGAQVMLIKNHASNPQLVNGSRGVVVRFEMDALDPTCKAPLPVVKFKNGDEEMIRYETWEIQDQAARPLASRTQVALKLAWCQTCHNAQGQTLNYVEVHIADAFDYGLAYVALTRFTSLTGLRIVNYNVQRIRNNPRVVHFNKLLRERPENQAIGA